MGEVVDERGSCQESISRIALREPDLEACEGGPRGSEGGPQDDVAQARYPPSNPDRFPRHRAREAASPEPPACPVWLSVAGLGLADPFEGREAGRLEIGERHLVHRFFPPLVNDHGHSSLAVLQSNGALFGVCDRTLSHGGRGRSPLLVVTPSPDRSGTRLRSPAQIAEPTGAPRMSSHSHFLTS